MERGKNKLLEVHQSESTTPSSLKKAHWPLAHQINTSPFPKESENDDLMILVLYGDDITLTRNDVIGFEKIKAGLKWMTLVKLDYFFGIESWSQGKYIENVLKEFECMYTRINWNLFFFIPMP